MITVNGKAVDCANISIAQYLEKEAYQTGRIAVEKNGEIVLKSEYSSTILCDGDKIEIVHFVGGG